MSVSKPIRWCGRYKGYYQGYMCPKCFSFSSAKWLTIEDVKPAYDFIDDEPLAPTMAMKQVSHDVFKEAK